MQLSKIFLHPFGHAKTVGTYTTIGLLSTLFYVGTAHTAALVFFLPDYISVAIGVTTAIFFSFIGHTYFTFKTTIKIKTFVKYIGVIFFNYPFTIAILWALKALNLNDQISLYISIFLGCVISFMINSVFVFQKTRS